MLKKKERLNRADFNRFFASGKRYHHEFFTIIASPYPTFHASVVVSKKIAAKAVVRNTLRRRVYAALRNVAQQKSIKGVYIVLLKSPAPKTTQKALREALVGMFGRIDESR